MLVSSLVIFFLMVRRGCAVGMRGKIVQFCCTLVRVIWHVLFSQIVFFHTNGRRTVPFETVLS